MRLFLAVELDGAARRAVERVARDLRSSLDGFDAALSGLVKWVDPHRVHVTLYFLGDVPASVVPHLERVLREPLAVSPFTVEFGGVGAFPATGPLRVLWLGCTTGSAELRTLHRALGDRLVGLPLAIETGPFTPHVTIGRFRQPGRPDVRSQLSAATTSRVGACAVASVTLFESRLFPGGPSYVARTRTDLAP